MNEQKIRTSYWHRGLIGLLMIYLIFPLLATLVYAFADQWDTTILPTSWTLKWFSQLYQDPRFLSSMLHSLLICTLSVGLSLVVMLPTIFIVIVYFPKWEKVIHGLSILPYAVPGVVQAVGLLKIYSNEPVMISGTIYIIIGAYFVAILPFMYLGIRNSMRTIHMKDLIDAAELLGSTKMNAFRLIIFPNILPGVLVSILLSFSVLFGEFVLANMLIGDQIETIQVYLYNKLGFSGHFASAIAISYFTFVLVLSAVIMKLSQWMMKVQK